MESHGWKLYHYRAFENYLAKLFADVDHLKQTKPSEFKKHPKAKFLDRILELITNEIPLDPAHEKFQLGNTLGPDNRKWRRAKFNRFRLFFRYNSASKIIIYAWINEEDQLRKAGDKSDPYRLFAKQLSKADPPESWEELLRVSQELK